MSVTTRILTAAAAAALAAAASITPAAAHTDPTSVTPANGSSVASAVTAVTVTYPEPVAVYKMTVTDGRSRQTVNVGRKTTSFTVPVKTGKGAWVASWDTRMPDGDVVTQATTWRVGTLPGTARPATRTASRGPVKVTVAVTDARPGASTSLRVSVSGGQLVETYATTAGVDVALSKTGGRLVLVKSTTVTSLVLTKTGTVETVTVRL